MEAAGGDPVDQGRRVTPEEKPKLASGWEQTKHELDRTAAVADRGQDRGWKETDRQQDRDRAVEDRNFAREKVAEDRDFAREKAVDDRHETREWALTDREDDQDVALRTLAWTAEYDRAKVIHDARVELAKGAVARAQAGAEFVRNAATGIVTIYQGVLALTFGIAAGQHTIPVSGLLPAVLLGLALTFACAYMAWLSVPPAVASPEPSASLQVYEARRLNVFSRWVSGIAMDRAYALHAAVLALGAGVVLLPVPFLGLDNDMTRGLAVVALAVVFLGPLVTKRI